MRTLGNAEDYAGVLHGEKPFGNVDIEKNGADESSDGYKERGGAEAQHKLQRAPVESDDRVKSIFRFAIEPALFLLFVHAEEFGAHHGSQRQRNKRRNQNSDRQGDGKLAEQPADNVAHEEKRNQHGDQRNGQRNDRESDLLGTF